MTRLVHDCLDAQLIDRRGVKCGRVDNIVLLFGDGPPQVVAIECGAVVVATRLHRRVGEWLARRLERRGSVAAKPLRFAWAALRREGNDFRIADDSPDTPLETFERWTRARLIGRLPGA